MRADSIRERIASAVESWPGVQASAHAGGMVFFHVGAREIGHLHGERMADLPFPVRIRERLVADGRADIHYIHPRSGWVTRYIRGECDVEPVIALFDLNYRRPWLKARESAPAAELVDHHGK